MARSTVHYADSDTNRILKRLHNKLRPAGTPVQRVEYIIELLLLRIFEVKIQHDYEFVGLRAAFKGDNEKLLFSDLITLGNDQILPTLNQKFFPFYARILSETRKVWEGNLSTKVQDQLVLIEEVFSNSNFSNNVTSGNMGEIIGLVAELDKDRLLKTDLLGDAIESALSETGGTKDIGLHRTPDHIRQFMVGLVAPTFHDQIFDPTVGTGGFMFDSFEYVMQGVSQDGHWPGPKSHPELAAWFKNWFVTHPVPMPSIETTTDFYRTGVGGIEYLGMVRKMAAINFYVRGLNPGNIQQGDALEKFGTEILPKSKTVVLANPPFGAERDKESYPNVWSEYPTESETTILFVKLMLESLKNGGRCAVIVSEGFLSWDQNSARALRRALLDECDLQAVISLPQGVFVSKGGQGPKTSILCFVKGGRTRNVWFYKVTNDGYTMGTNRKPVPGCQLVEALHLFHRHVREGKQPPESRHSFCIPADWIKVLDPRVKDKIRAETRAEMSARAAEEKNKLTEKLDAQVVAKKLTAIERKDRLAQHDELWQSKIENAIAQKIERAHLYSFNLSNYRSSLTPEQLAAWKDFAATYVREDDPSKTLEKQYRAIATAAPDELDELISGLEPRHTLELDIARQFLTGVSSETFTKHPHLRTLQEIIASQQKTQRVSLKGLLRLNTDAVAPANFPDTRFRVLGVSNEIGVFLNETLVGSEIRQRYYRVKPGEFCYNPYRINVGSIGLNEFDYDNQIISGAYVVFGTEERELHPKFLGALFKTPQFLSYVNDRASGGVRMNFKFEHLEDWQIPALDLQEQESIVVTIERQQQLVSAAESLASNYELLAATVPECRPQPLATVIRDVRNGIYKPEGDYGEGTPILRIDDFANGQVITSSSDLKMVRLSNGEVRRYGLQPDDIVLNRVNSLEHVGKVALVGKISSATVYESNMMRLRLDTEQVFPEFVFRMLASPAVAKELKAKAKQAVNQFSVNQGDVGEVLIPIPSKAVQERVLASIDSELATLDRVEELARRAQATISRILSHVWEN
jgi:type I restriction enzyme M protein